MRLVDDPQQLRLVFAVFAYAQAVGVIGEDEVKGVGAAIRPHGENRVALFATNDDNVTGKRDDAGDLLIGVVEINSFSPSPLSSSRRPLGASSSVTTNQRP